MKTYNVDADDDYEFHRNSHGGSEYRGSGYGAYRGYGDNSSGGANASSSRGGGGGGYSSLARGSGSGQHGGYGGSGSSSSHAQTGSGYMQHGGDRGGSSSHYGKSSPSVTEKPAQVGDARYAAAQAAVATALGHTTISGPPAPHAAGGGSYGGYSHYGSGGMARAPSPAAVHHISSRGGGGGSGPGGGPPRYNPSNGDSSGGSGGYQGGGRGDPGSTSQPRPMARPGGVASHEYTSRGLRPAAHSPVSTVLGGTYHNYAVPPGGMPLGGSGSGGGEMGQQQQQQHYVSRSVPMTRGEDSRDRDGHGGRGGKRGRW